MVDPYSMLIQMAAEGKAADVIAKAVGWPLDAVETMVEELMSADAHGGTSEPEFA